MENFDMLYNNSTFYQPNPIDHNNKEKRPNKKIKLENNEFDFDDESWEQQGDFVDKNFSLGSSKLTQSYIDLIINPSDDTHHVMPNNNNNNNNNNNMNNNNNLPEMLNITHGNDNMAFFNIPGENEHMNIMPIEMCKIEQQVNRDDSAISAKEPLLDQIKMKLQQYEMEINKVYEQCTTKNYPNKKSILEFKESIENLCDEIHYLLQKKILHVVNVYYSHWLLQQLSICTKRLDLITNELEYLEEKMSKTDAVDILTAFVFIDQPLSQSFKNKNRARQVNTKKKSHCIMKAAILTSPNTNFKFSKPVMAMFTTRDDTTSKPDITLESNSEEMSKNINVITFNFRFPVGTRCKPAQLRLEVEGDVFLPDNPNKFGTTIKSECSNNFVVATNECQWEGAEGKLLLFDLFGEDYMVGSQKTSKRKKKKNAKDQKEATWPFFVNQLAVRFIRATRQETSINEMMKKLSNGELDQIFKRVLIEIDINYLHETRFNNSLSVNPQQVETFWEWYGKTLHIFRHNSHIRTIFLEGLFFSLISKEKATQLLVNQRPGTFLIRTSERSTKGEFALAFVSENDRIKHTKIESQKIQPPHNSLPDYIKDIQQLIYVIKAPCIGTQDYVILPKDPAFQKFYTKKIKDVDDGYEDIDD